MSADYPKLPNTGKDNEQYSGLSRLERITYSELREHLEEHPAADINTSGSIYEAKSSTT